MEKEHIIKALECCFVQEANCPECPYTGTYPECQGYVGNQAISLICEQEKRIEELEKEAAFWEGETDNAIDIAEGNIRAEIASGGTSCHWCEDKIKADTVRKMQEAIKERCLKGGIYPVFVKNAIDNVASELLEKKDG